jgi:hypothetical protein
VTTGRQACALENNKNTSINTTAVDSPTHPELKGAHANNINQGENPTGLFARVGFCPHGDATGLAVRALFKIAHPLGTSRERWAEGCWGDECGLPRQHAPTTCASALHIERGGYGVAHFSAFPRSMASLPPPAQPWKSGPSGPRKLTKQKGASAPEYPTHPHVETGALTRPAERSSD